MSGDFTPAFRIELRPVGKHTMLRKLKRTAGLSYSRAVLRITAVHPSTGDIDNRSLFRYLLNTGLWNQSSLVWLRNVNTGTLLARLEERPFRDERSSKCTDETDGSDAKRTN